MPWVRGRIVGGRTPIVNATTSCESSVVGSHGSGGPLIQAALATGTKQTGTIGTAIAALLETHAEHGEVALQSGFEGGLRFAGSTLAGYGVVMSTVQEIEAAAEQLPSEQKEELLRLLAVRLRKDRAESKPRLYSSEEVASMVAEDEADGDLFRQGR